MRVLVASTAGSGHFTPLVPWIEALVAAGHEVAVCGPSSLAPAVARWDFRDCGQADPELVGALFGQAMSGQVEDVAAHVVGGIFTRTNAGALLEGMTEVVASFQPDLVLREPMEFASAVVAARAGVAQVRIAISLARHDAFMMRHASPVLEEWEPGITDVVCSTPYLTRFPATLDGAVGPVTRYRIGSRIARRVEQRFVYATLGTEAPRMTALAGWLPVVRDALAGLDVDALLTVGRVFDPAAIEPAPRLRVEPWADHRDVLGRAAAIVHHGGSGTTLDALAAGVPQVIVPLFADQGTNGAALSEAGVAVSLHGLDGVRPMPPYEGAAERLRNLVEATLADDGATQRAEQVAAEMAVHPELGLAMLGVPEPLGA